MKEDTSRLTRFVEEARRQGKRALIPFVTAGTPSKEAFWSVLEELAASGADIIEIGVPFSDPVADGPVVAKASEKALADGVDLEYILEGLAARRKTLQHVGIVLMGYANPFVQYAWKHKEREHSYKYALGNITEQVHESLLGLAHALTAAGVDGLIIPDLPLAERGLWLETLQKAGIDLIPLVGLNTPLERMREYAQTASGFVYMVSVLGITGGRQEFTERLEAMMERAKEAFSLPLALGFGLQTPDQLEAMPAKCRPDAVVFGSALIRHLWEGKSAKAFMAPWTAHF